MRPHHILILLLSLCNSQIAKGGRDEDTNFISISEKDDAQKPPNYDPFPPPTSSYYVPYGDRLVISLTFPQRAPITLVPLDVWGTPLPILYSSPPPPPVYGPPPPKKPMDLAIIISQNYVFRENVRDYGNFSQLFSGAKSSQEVLREAGKLFAASRQLKKRNANRTRTATTGSYDSYGPPEKEKTFALIGIETRVKLSASAPSNFTNFTILFPSPEDPNVLAQYSLPGSSSSSSSSLPGDVSSFLTLLQGIHQDTLEDGKERVSRIKKFSSSLSRPRLPNILQLRDNPRGKEEEERARGTHWLLTSTIGLREISPQELVKLQVVYGPPTYGPPTYGPPTYGPPTQQQQQQSSYVAMPTVRAYGDTPPPPPPQYPSHPQQQFVYKYENK